MPWRGHTETCPPVSLGSQGVATSDAVLRSPPGAQPLPNRPGGDGRGLVHVVARVRQTQRTYTSEDAHVSTYRDGQLIRFRVYTDTAATAAAYQG